MGRYADILTDDVINEAVAGACIILHGQAVRYAPIDSGFLRNSISWSVEGKLEGLNSGGSAAGSDSAHGVDIATEKYTGHVGSGAEYAEAVEYGRPDMPNYPMQPYLRPAAVTTKAKREKYVAGIIAREMAKAVKK